jgi:transposase
MVSGVSKDPSSVAVAVETIASVRAEKDLVIAALQAHSALLTKQLEAALYRIDQLARQIFCRSSERYDHPEQQRIDLGAMTPGSAAGPVTVIPPLAQGIVAGKESRAAKPKRKPIPDTMERVHLPARELSLEQRTLPDGRVLVPVGEETNERIHFIEPKFVAEVEHLIVYGLPNAADGSLSNIPAITAPPAPQIILNGLPTTALLVQIVFAKFGMHLPLHRQSKDFARLGCEIAKSTMCGWLNAFAAFLDPVLKALEKQVLASNLLYSDDIPEDMLDPGSGKTKIIRFWSYLGHGPDGGQLPQVLFSFTEDRAGRHPSDMLADYHGVLMADALARSLRHRTASLPPITSCACSAGHMRDADFTTPATPIRAAMKYSS